MGKDYMTILTFLSYYLPGYKAGGPMRSVSNIVDRLGDEFHFKIVTSDRDYLDRQPYPGIRPDAWTRAGKAEVLYCSPQGLSCRNFYRVLHQLSYDAIYLNSLVSPRFTLVPLLLLKYAHFDSKPVVVAPRGELSPGALAQKGAKKAIYLRLVKLLGLYQNVFWQASTELDAGLIRSHFGAGARIWVADDLFSSEDQVAWQHGRAGYDKAIGHVRVVFLSRISPMKNLLGALEMLAGVREAVQFDIYGPVDDAEYWSQCQATIARLPSNIRVAYRGHVSHADVLRTLASYDLFLLPTLGENFGHVILEALVAGCPVLISDQTPWTGLEDLGVGWDVPLSNLERFRQAIRKVAGMDRAEHLTWSSRARTVGLLRANDAGSIEQNRKLFLTAVSAGS
jgi:glycosyltransferase involved in cell wall biosynthesis